MKRKDLNIHKMIGKMMKFRMNSVFKNIAIKYNIDLAEFPNREILEIAYEDEKNIDEKFLRSIGIFIEPLDLRVYKKYNRRKEKI